MCASKHAIRSDDAPYKNESLLRQKYWGEGMSLADIGDEYDCNYMTIKYWMDKFGIPTEDNGTRENAPWKDEENLERLYCDVGLNTHDLADLWDCDNSNISYWLKKYGIEIEQYDAQRAAKELWDESYLQEKYVEQGLSCNEIADELDVCHTTVLKALEREGIERRVTSHVGEKHWNWKGGVSPDYGDNWDEQREKTLERDNHTCQYCGTSSGTIDVHHIHPIKEFDIPEEGNRLSNLVVLCRDCHTDWEGVYLRPDTR